MSDITHPTIQSMFAPPNPTTRLDPAREALPQLKH